MQTLKLAGAPGSRSPGFRLMIAACAVVIPAGCHSTPRLTPQQAAGKHLYDVRCAHCHDENDLALKKAPPDLHGLFGKTTLPSGSPATDSEVERVVLAGKGMMPSFAGRFTQEQMSDLLAYLHTGMHDQPTK
jgi:mono/diheme cytochrome c family protein